MEALKIKGGRPLEGEVKISGAKNAVLPILAGTVLAEGKSVIERVPNLQDVKVMKRVLETLGAEVEIKEDKMTVAASKVDKCRISEELMRKMRATVFLMGPLVARFGEVEISQPGGCSIGSRPIDLHLKGLKALGVEFESEHGSLRGTVEQLTGAEIHLDFPSVGATENIMMAATLAEGKTLIHNAAKEPEIVDLQNFLNQLGAKVKGAGTDVIKIEGVKELKPVVYEVIPDRIEAGTYLLAGAITGGEVAARNLIPKHIEAVLAKLVEAGIEVETGETKVEVKGIPSWEGINLKTLPYPGFPTDMQPQFMSLLSLADGSSVITETIFDNRLKHADELKRMGADIRLEGNSAILRGVDKLSGAAVEAIDLRAGAALILAGLAAEGETQVEKIYHVDRGYEFLEEKFSGLGAEVSRENFAAED